MKDVRLLKLTFYKFKGIDRLSVDFNNDITNIYGANKAGKTTIFDGFAWIIGDKNSNDEQNFDIKPLDENNELIDRKSDHWVEAVISENGMHATYKKVYKEKWEKKRGELEPEFTGHETLYYYNGVKIPQGSFKEKIGSIVHPELFKLLTNPFYFSKLKWEVQRTALYKLVGDITDKDIAAGRADFEHLLSIYKDLKQAEKELASKRKMLTDQVKEIPIRINEIVTNTPDPVDEEVITGDIAIKTSEMDQIDIEIADISKAAESANKIILDRKKEILELKNKKNKIEFEAKQALQKVKNDAITHNNKLTFSIDKIEKQIKTVEVELRSVVSKIAQSGVDKQALIDKWHTENEKEFDENSIVFDESEFSCPTCKRLLDAVNIEEKKKEFIDNAREDFNEKKAIKLSGIESAGAVLNQRIDALTKDQKKLSDDLTALEESLVKENEFFQANKIVSDDTAELILPEEYNEVVEKITSLEQIESQTEPSNTTELVNKRKSIQVEIDTLKKSLSVNETIASSNLRVEKLEKEEKVLSQEIADVEKLQFTLEAFNKSKIEITESLINQKFDGGVRFKMYNLLVNGSEEPTCIILVDGVPFSSANRASQINAGISIINTFSQHYQITAPIFIDNAEAVNELQPSNSQMIRLVVSTDKQLIIN